jgi:hypothetical protein
MYTSLSYRLNFVTANCVDNIKVIHARIIPEHLGAVLQLVLLG